MNGSPTARDYNKATILEVVLTRAPLTRNDLIELTGLSKATVSRAVEELRTDGFVVDGRVDEVAGRGRRSTYLDVPASAGHVIGISLGAQQTGVLVADLRSREIQHVLLPTVHHDDPAEAAAWLVELMQGAATAADGPLRQVVLAVPGRVQAGTEIAGLPEAMTTYVGAELQRTVAHLAQAPVLLDSDANASLLAILAEDDSLDTAALFSTSSILNFATCTHHELVRGRSTAFGDVGVLVSGVADEALDGLLSTGGLLRYARERGLDLERIEDVWGRPHDKATRDDVLASFTTALVTAVTAAAVTLDPPSLFFVGRLQPLVEEVLPEVRARLAQKLSTPPDVTTPPQVLGLSVARGAVSEGLRMTRDRLREVVLDARRQDHPAQPSPAY